MQEILFHESINIEDNDDVGTMHDKLSVLGANLLKETLPSIVNGTNDSISQDDTKQHSLQILAEDERIDWTMNAKIFIIIFVAYHHRPVGYTTMDDTNLKLYAAHIVHNKKGNQGNRRND